LTPENILTQKQHRPLFLRHIRHLPQAFLLESRIPHRQDLVCQEDLWLQVSRHGKGQSNVHAAVIKGDVAL